LTWGYLDERAAATVLELLTESLNAAFTLDVGEGPPWTPMGLSTSESTNFRYGMSAMTVS
jgi:hypothetical protein